MLADLEPALRQGVFATPGKTWQAVMRLSNGNAYPQFDRIRDARGMAIKLLDVPGEKLTRDPRHAGEPIALTVNYCAAIAEGEFTIELDFVRSSRTTQHVAIRLVQPDRRTPGQNSVVIQAMAVITWVQRTANSIHSPITAKSYIDRPL